MRTSCAVRFLPFAIESTFDLKISTESVCAFSPHSTRKKVCSMYISFSAHGNCLLRRNSSLQKVLIGQLSVLCDKSYHRTVHQVVFKDLIVRHSKYFVSQTNMRIRPDTPPVNVRWNSEDVLVLYIVLKIVYQIY